MRGFKTFITGIGIKVSIAMGSLMVTGSTPGKMAHNTKVISSKDYVKARATG